MIYSLSTVSLPPNGGASGGCLDVFQHMVSIMSVLWEVGAFLGDGHGIAGENYVVLLTGNKMSAWYHYRN